MPFRLFDAPLREPSQFVGFAGNDLDRQSENRDEESLVKALTHPEARLMLVNGGRAYLKLKDGLFDPHFTPAESVAFKAQLDHAVLLGFDATGPRIVVPAGVEPDDLPLTVKAIDYRSVYVQGLIALSDLGAMAQGVSLLAWHSSHRFCSKCGHESEMSHGGYRRVCPNCGTEHFPRTDPVAIMLTVSGEKCLLGRSPRFAPGMYSCLAGFIEPGETIENAVRRETLEEAGIRLGRVVYQASQPWPFPHSLMIGCYGEALSEDIHADLNELEDCRWFTREEVRAIIAGNHEADITIPPPGAIASHLIRTWAEED
ncbi:NAD(+) diphosphatase [Mesorhizobium koreense]|uniref:NAD(+) diphosphatase n=1 Tax=Mesorhizobium koreense TaxID=3074855 RepID=UPI00287BBCA1|nr:NAD(+) diphosphatase [Mesorhizobium sp. WR6]